MAAKKRNLMRDAADVVRRVAHLRVVGSDEVSPRRDRSNDRWAVWAIPMVLIAMVAISVGARLVVEVHQKAVAEVVGEIRANGGFLEPEQPIPTKVGEISNGSCLDNLTITNLGFEGRQARELSMLGTEILNGHLAGAYLEGMVASFNPRTKRGKIANTDLKGAHLEGSTINGITIVDTDMRGAHLEGASLQETTLLRCRLQGITVGEYAKVAGTSTFVVDTRLWNTRFIDCEIDRPTAEALAGLEQKDGAILPKSTE